MRWLWSLVPFVLGCSTCPTTNCSNDGFVLLSTGACIANVATDCTVQTMACTQAIITALPVEAGMQTCTIAATLTDGTTLAFSVDFTFQGNDRCCGPHYTVVPPTLVVGEAPRDASFD